MVIGGVFVLARSSRCLAVVFNVVEFGRIQVTSWLAHSSNFSVMTLTLMLDVFFFQSFSFANACYDCAI